MIDVVILLLFDSLFGGDLFSIRFDFDTISYDSIVIIVIIVVIVAVGFDGDGGETIGDIVVGDIFGIGYLPHQNHFQSQALIQISYSCFNIIIAGDHVTLCLFCCIIFIIICLHLFS